MLSRQGRTVTRALHASDCRRSAIERSFIAALLATHYRDPATSRQAREGINRWIAEFAAACRRAVADVNRFESSVERLMQSWKARLAQVRADATALKLLQYLPGMPILTVDIAAKLAGRSFPVANQAIGRLVEARILTERNKNRRNRVFEAHEILEEFTMLERSLASPTGDTRIAALFGECRNGERNTIRSLAA